MLKITIKIYLLVLFAIVLITFIQAVQHPDAESAPLIPAEPSPCNEPFTEDSTSHIYT